MDVIRKAAALSIGWHNVTGSDPPSRDAVLWPLGQADLETQDGDAWGAALGPHNWGAVDLRPPNANEMAAIQAGTLKTGHWLHADGTWGPTRLPDDIGQLHLDSHPGGTSYAMWFRAFVDDAAGATSFLRVVLAKVGGAAFFHAPEPILEEYASRLYIGGYFEGTVPGARPYGHRAEPLTSPELANVAKYVSGITRCIGSVLAPALAGWTVPGGATGDTVAGDGGVTTDAQQSGPGPGWEGNDGSAPST